MRYVMLVYGEESCWTETERNECIVESMALCDRWRNRKVLDLLAT